ncbi:trehalase-like [Lemur catta]|uniref:trehalase-like n=1 Tax=Lemur catta TaxID=9447 RepID=UPI001E269A80|nr:trehalase-like [Lemur catta]
MHPPHPFCKNSCHVQKCRNLQSLRRALSSSSPHRKPMPLLPSGVSPAQGWPDSAAPGNDSQARKYRTLREQRLDTLSAVLWDEDSGAWFDYDLETGKKNQEFYPSNLTPLWAGCFSDPGVADKALKYLEDSQILTYQYGIPTSLQQTGQQWDFPNAWAPLQDVVIRGLAKSSSPRAQEVAFQLAQTGSEPTLMSTPRRQPCMRSMTSATVDSPVVEGSMKFRRGLAGPMEWS